MSLTITASEVPFFWQMGTGISEASNTISIAINEARTHEKKSIVLGWRQGLLNSLGDISKECVTKNWDGYQAEPVTSPSVMAATHLIDLLPKTSPLPDLVPTPGGNISFEWDCGKDYLFSFTIQDGKLIFGSILGPERKLHGQEPLGEELPENISSILERFFPPT